jgi:hypothetical protein
MARPSATWRPREPLDQEPPVWRLNMLRAAYLLVVIGLGLQVWPGIILHHASWTLMEGVVQCMLGAFSLLALWGLRHPLLMLPILLWEITWKGMWLALVAAPKWATGRMDEDTLATAFACLLVVVFLIAVPWGHVAKTLVTGPGARWR